MALVAAVLGVALVALGAVVLLRFPDRPGGRVRLLGLEVSSLGAGLPVIALGVLVVLAGGLSASDDTSTSSTPSTESSSSGSGGGGSGSANVRAMPADLPACAARFFRRSPRVSDDRRRALPAEAEDVDVIGAGEPKRDEFALVLTQVGRFLGAVKLSYDPDASQYAIAGAIDRRCRAIPWSSRDTPASKPDIVNNFDELRLRLDARDYLIELKASNEIELELHRYQQ
jgi:hypothetical protein